MKEPIYIKLEPSEQFDLHQLLTDYSNNKSINLVDCNLSIIQDPEYYFRETIIKSIIEFGFTKYIEADLLNEYIVKPNTPRNVIETVIVNYLNVAGIDSELIITDPYFFAPRIDSTYVPFISNIIKRTNSDLKKLIIITPDLDYCYSESTKNSVISGLKAVFSDLEITHSFSRKVHDRFWISNNRSKGIITGTSINGLGKKYCLIDHLEDADVLDLITDLKSEGLI